jgi:sulfite exporter TauE/SafE
MEVVHDAHVTSALAALCGTSGPLGLFGIAFALCGVGLIGGFGHCAPMCGPFVVMQLAEAEGRGFVLRKLVAGAAPGYQLGRMTTYTALGAAAGGLGGSLVALSRFHWLVAVLLGLAAASFLLQALKLVFPPLAAPIWGGLGGWLARPLTMLIRGQRRIALGGYPLGLVLGLLPCGFLYASLFAAAATGAALAGAVAMAGFALGTMPALIAVGVLGSSAASRWRSLARRLTAPVFLINAVILGGLAARAVA